MSFTTKDSGQRVEFSSGMKRDTEEGKTLYHLLYDGPLLQRWAELLTRGAKKYEEGNWMKASGKAEYDRFKKSAARHFHQWMTGERDEDHAAAVVFNLNGAEYVLDKLDDQLATAEEAHDLGLVPALPDSSHYPENAPTNTLCPSVPSWASESPCPDFRFSSHDAAPKLKPWWERSFLRRKWRGLKAGIARTLTAIAWRIDAPATHCEVMTQDELDYQATLWVSEDREQQCANDFRHGMWS